MEALPISNAATPIAPRSRATPATEVNRATSANGVPVFAQAVREALGRVTDSSAGQAPSSKQSPSPAPNPSPKGARPEPTDKPQKQDTAISASASSSPTLVVLPNLVAQPLVPVLQLQPTANASSPDNTGSAATAPGSQAGSADTAESISPGRATADGSTEPLQAPLPPIDVTQTSFIAGAAAAVNTAPGKQTGSSDGLAPLKHEAAATAFQQQTPSPVTQELAGTVNLKESIAAKLAAALQPHDPNTGTKSAPAPPPAAFQPLLDPQPQTKVTQSNGALVAGLPIDGSRPRPLPIPASGIVASEELQPVTDALRAAAPTQGPSTGSSSRDNPQDSSSSHKDSGQPKATWTTDTAAVSVSAREGTSFSQALINPLNLKQDATTTLNAPSAPPSSVAIPVAKPTVVPPDSQVRSTQDPTQSPVPLSTGADEAASRMVSSAKLLEAAGHSEMHVAMGTDKLGGIEVRARMVGDEIGAAITVEKREAHQILAVELPALQQELSDKQIRFQQVTLLHGTLSSTTGDGGASTQHEQRNTQRSSTWALSGDAGRTPFTFSSKEGSEIFDAQGRLSVRA